MLVIACYVVGVRYMLEGIDQNGKKCRLFIENDGTSLDNCIPKIYTDREKLAFLESAKLTADVECVENGVFVRIYEK